MGLDMYLFRRTKDRSGEGEEVTYWRKANQIRQWFVSNCGYKEDADCVAFPLTREQLIKLRDDCAAVLNGDVLAEEVLPTSDGFFFGNTEYDEWYFKDLEYTYKEVDRVIKETDWDAEEVCYYEWW